MANERTSYRLEVCAYEVAAKHSHRVITIDLEGHTLAEAKRIAVRECKEARRLGHMSVFYELHGLLGMFGTGDIIDRKFVA